MIKEKRHIRSKYRNFIKVREKKGNRSLYNLICEDEKKFECDTWYRFIDEFDENGLAKVQREDGLWNFINIEGEILSKNIWYMYVSRFDENRIAQVQCKEDELYNLINTKSKIICENWYRFIDNFNKEGIARVIREDISINFINTKGEEQF